VQHNTPLVYINFPFTSQNKYDDKLIERYHRALCSEITRHIKKTNSRSLVDAIYFGGGDLSLYPGELLLDTSGTLEKGYNNAVKIEITAEICTDKMSTTQMLFLIEAGINRLNVGWNIRNGRLYRDKSKMPIVTLLREANSVFDNSAVDLTFESVPQDLFVWEEALRSIVETGVKHVSVQFMIKQVKRGFNTRLKHFYSWLTELFNKNGLQQYETFHFAKKNNQSRYMKAYWRRSLCKGFGAGAVSFDGQMRYHNESDVEEYIACIENNDSAIFFAESLLPYNVFVEKIMFGVRQLDGFEIEDLLQHLSFEKRTRFLKQLDQLALDGFITLQNGRALINGSLLFLEQEIIQKILV